MSKLILLVSVLLVLVWHVSTSLTPTTNKLTTIRHRQHSTIHPGKTTNKPRNTTDGQWKQFKDRHHRKFDNTTHEKERRHIWERKMKWIAQHNELAKKGVHKYTVHENNFTDWTTSEYKKLLGYVSSRKAVHTSRSHSTRHPRYSTPNSYRQTNTSSLPATVDWAAQGYVGPVLDQGNCGSCWSFAACAALEGQVYNLTKILTALSQQHLIDCSIGIYGNMGCGGGNMQNAYQYVIVNGIQSSYTYPYNTDNMQAYDCKYNESLVVTKIQTWKETPAGDELALQEATALVGPISVGIDAGEESFQLYDGGVYSDAQCSSVALNHAVTITGYGTYEGTPYWLIKNSWGTNWGIDGYMMMERNADNMCGIATDATYPVIPDTSYINLEQAEAADVQNASQSISCTIVLQIAGIIASFLATHYS